MSNKDDRILARELGKLGALTGVIGGPAGIIRGGIGVYLVARLLPNDTYELVTEIDASPEMVLNTAFSILRREGKILEDSTNSTVPTVTGVVGSGVMNLNPAIVRVQVSPASNHLTRVSIFGSAKEGLIKQHAGEKAAKKIGDLIISAFQ